MRVHARRQKIVARINNLILYARFKRRLIYSALIPYPLAYGKNKKEKEKSIFIVIVARVEGKKRKTTTNRRNTPATWRYRRSETFKIC